MAIKREAGEFARPAVNFPWFARRPPFPGLTGEVAMPRERLREGRVAGGIKISVIRG